MTKTIEELTLEDVKQMKLEDIKDLMLEKQIDENDCYCMGDIWHNQIIENLFDGIEDNAISRTILSNIAFAMVEHFNYRDKSIYTNSDFRHTTLKWYDRVYGLNKGDYRKLNALMKSKSLATLQKRMASFLKKQTNGYYTTLLNSGKIRAFDKLFDEILLQYK